MDGNNMTTIKIYFANFFRDKSNLSKQQIDNYYENMINTDQAKIIAHKRTEFMKTYLSELFAKIIKK